MSVSFVFRSMRALRSDGETRSLDIELTLIPYYAWCHRGANEMAVWLPRTEEAADPLPMPTIASLAKPSASRGNPAAARKLLDDCLQQEHIFPHREDAQALLEKLRAGP